MSQLRVQAFSVSVDGFSAGPHQDLEHPLGVGGPEIFDWVFHTRTFGDMHGPGGGETGVDDGFAARGFANIGAWILGRNMFGPERGPWQDSSWKGWWGENPPYHTPTYILTHHARPSIEMEGGTVFHFVTGGIEAALKMAREGAKGKDIRVGGGVQTIRQYLNARLVDEMHLAVSPAPLGAGENLFAGLNLPALGYACAEYVPSEKAMHITFRRASAT